MVASVIRTSNSVQNLVEVRSLFDQSRMEVAESDSLLFFVEETHQHVPCPEETSLEEDDQEEAHLRDCYEGKEQRVWPAWSYRTNES